MRELVEADLKGLVRGKAPAVRRFRDSHHRVARLFAMGLRSGEVAEATGYSNVRISTLRGDPAFEELVVQYREDVDADWRNEVVDYYANINKARDITARMILDQLVEADDAAEPIPLRTLAGIHGDLADRTGYGKRSTQVNVNVDFAAQLDKAIKRSNGVKTIDSQPGVSAALRREGDPHEMKVINPPVASRPDDLARGGSLLRRRA